MELLGAAFVYLVAAVIAVPIANKLGLGSVLGYLLAGVVIGPVLGVVGAEAVAVQHFAEFGVVMMLFLVGLELQPSMLWRMRKQLIGLGGLQVVITMGAITGIAMGFGLPWQSALATGMILSLSSTAIVLQTLNEKGWMKTKGGEGAFSVLLTQDIAVIPMLAFLPLLALGSITRHGGSTPANGVTETAHEAVKSGALDALPGWAHGLVILGVIIGIIIGGRYLIKPMFRFIAEAKLREVFTAAALMLVIGIALAMDLVGLSPALGTFLAGVVLSDSEYRHELESDIEPFKGLLLGLFFLTVGAGIDFSMLFAEPVLLVGLALGLMLLKSTILLGLAKLFKFTGADRWLFALSLAQAGEFAFVLFGFALASGAMEPGIAKQLTLVVALTMMFTPALFILYEKVIAPRAVSANTREPDVIEEKGNVVIAGMGRFGQIITRMLNHDGHNVIVLDYDPATIDNLARLGVRTYYGDATRPDLLHSAGLADAKLFISAIDDREKQTLIVAHVAKAFPHVRIIARAIDRHHIYELENAGAHVVERETFESSIAVGRKALVELGLHPYQAESQAKKFRRFDEAMVEAMRDNYNDGGMDNSYIDAVRSNIDILNEIMTLDRAEFHDHSPEGWMPPPKQDPETTAS